MLGYYTVKLVGAGHLPLPERIRLETAYVAQLEALAGGQQALLAWCAAAREEPRAGAAQQRLQAAGEQAEAAARGTMPDWPAGARFSLSLWTAQNL
jgi:hypothetical protein